MKTTLILAALILSACTTVTETRPDGTVVKTTAMDVNVFSVGAGAVTTLGEMVISGK